MHNKTKTLIIFGCSERISEISNRIPELISNFDTLGLNRFPEYYPTKYRLWIDNEKYGYCIFRQDDGEYKPFHPFTSADLKLGWTVAVPAIDWAIKQGYKKVILYGVLDGEYKQIDDDYYSYHYFYSDEVGKIHKKALSGMVKYVDSFNEQIDIDKNIDRKLEESNYDRVKNI